MPYIMKYAHIVWATKYRHACITPSIETVILDAIQAKSKELRSPIHAINTAYDHLHVAVTIHSALSDSEWIRQAKAFSSHLVNREFPDLENRFYWQGSYSYHSFGHKQLHFVTGYIVNQKQHHQNNELEEYLEYIPDD